MPHRARHDVLPPVPSVGGLITPSANVTSAAQRAKRLKSSNSISEASNIAGTLLVCLFQAIVLIRLDLGQEDLRREL